MSTRAAAAREAALNSMNGTNDKVPNNPVRKDRTKLVSNNSKVARNTRKSQRTSDVTSTEDDNSMLDAEEFNIGQYSAANPNKKLHSSDLENHPEPALESTGYASKSQEILRATSPLPPKMPARKTRASGKNMERQVSIAGNRGLHNTQSDSDEMVTVRSTSTPLAKSQGLKRKQPMSVDIATSPSSTKRPKTSVPRGRKTVTQEAVKGGWNELPHNMGPISTSVSGNTNTNPNTNAKADGETVTLSAGNTGNTTEGLTTSGVSDDAVTGAEVKVEDDEADIATKPQSERIAKTRGSKALKKDLQLPTPKTSDESSPETTMEVSRKGSLRKSKLTSKMVEETELPTKQASKSKVSRNEQEATVKQEDISSPADEDLQTSNAGTGTQKNARTRKSAAASDVTPSKKRSERMDTSKKVVEKVDDLVDGIDSTVADTKLTPKSAPRKKRLPYGLTPGESPFPDYAVPTSEQAYEVNQLLSEVHGKVEAPKEIPAPSLTVSGCGEVPSVLDALIRTLLSASTTGQNAAYAFQGLVDRYGLYEDGIGKGSVNWNKVREASLDDCEKAIRRGGLSKMKSKNIKAILDLVYKQNMDRKDAFLDERKTGKTSAVLGAGEKTQGQKDLEIETANSNILSLQYMHGLDAEAAMTEFTKFPGIGVKTSSCVILFCLQRPSFAVDTHVYRLCQWLKWVPDDRKVTRDQTFSHCEVRIPNELKYSLHQLFIRHGKTCGRCRAATGETSEEWERTVCPIEHLVTRTGARKAAPGVNTSPKKTNGKATTPKKSGKSAPRKTAVKKRKAKKADSWDGDSEAADSSSALSVMKNDTEDEMPELSDDDESTSQPIEYEEI